MKIVFNASGVVVRFERSPTDRLNPSCCLNLRRDDHEADLVIWESGEAELTIGTINGVISHKHFDDLRNRIDLSTALSALSELAILTSKSTSP